MISTCAGRKRVRWSGSLVADSTRRIAAAASVDAALGQAEQRQPRLRIAAALAGQRIGLLGFRQLAAEAMDLALLVERVAGARRPSSAPVGSMRARASSKASGHAPPSCRISERWIRHCSGERHELRLSLAPSAERSRPFARAIERVALLAGRDDAAVDQPGDERRELAARRGHHRLVEERQAFREPTVPDQRASLEVPAERAQVAVAVAIADLGSLRGSRPSGRVIAGGREAEHVRQPQVAALDAVLSFAIDQALRAREPAARPGASRRATIRRIANQNAARAARRRSPASSLS